MNPILRSLMVLTLSAGALAFSGCAVEAVDEGDLADAEDTASSEEALSSAERGFVGSWVDGVATGRDYASYFATLTLERNGKYAATVADPRIRCVRAPCVLNQSGTWSAYRSGSALKLRLSTSDGARRIYGAALGGDSLTLTRLGTKVTLAKKAPNATCANVRCPAGTWCNDNGGAGPVTCDPVAAACKRTGCSGQVCSDRDVMTTCEYRAEYACYNSAICERGSSGECGWRQTPALAACLASAGGI